MAARVHQLPHHVCDRCGLRHAPLTNVGAPRTVLASRVSLTSWAHISGEGAGVHGLEHPAFRRLASWGRYACRRSVSLACGQIEQQTREQAAQLLACERRHVARQPDAAGVDHLDSPEQRLVVDTITRRRITPHERLKALSTSPLGAVERREREPSASQRQLAGLRARALDFEARILATAAVSVRAWGAAFARQRTRRRLRVAIPIACTFAGSSPLHAAPIERRAVQVRLASQKLAAEQSSCMVHAAPSAAVCTHRRAAAAQRSAAQLAIVIAEVGMHGGIRIVSQKSGRD